jgi:hypothetical protein
VPINKNSILDSTKQILGLDFDYTAFDLDIITHINSVFTTLLDLGVGPKDGFAIEDNTTEWSAYLTSDFPAPKFNMVRSYMYMKVRSLFDPPATSFALQAQDKVLAEMEFRINSMAEAEHIPSDPSAGGFVWDLTGRDETFPDEARSGELGYDSATGDVWEKL